MKNRTLTPLIVATSLLLPTAALAGDGNKKPHKDQDQVRHEQSATGMEQQNEHASTSTQAEDRGYRADMTQSNQDWSSNDSQTFASTGSSEIRRIDEAASEGRITADRLIGKDVVDNQGEQIGTVSDIALGSAVPNSFHLTNVERSESEGVASDGYGLTDDAENTENFDQQQARGSADELEVYVSVGGFLGMGEDVVAVPVSRLSFDAENDQLQLDASSDEISALADDGDDESNRYSASE